MKVSVLGGGHGCYAAAVDLTEKSHDVTLWRRDKDLLKSLQDKKTISVLDAKGEREVEPANITDDISIAIKESNVIVIPLPATTHEVLAVLTAELWQDGQVIFLPPGTFGSYIFLKAARDAGNQADVTFAETGTLPYLARKRDTHLVAISGYATRLPTGMFPAKNTDHAFPLLQQAYPSIEGIEDALSGALMNAGAIIHTPLILMNAGPLEHFEKWDIHNEGTQSSIRATTDSLDAERIAIREAFGYVAPHFPLADHYDAERDEWMYGNVGHEKLHESRDWCEDIGLTSHRYMLEDVELGLAFLASCADYLQLDCPLTNGLLAIGSAINGRDFKQSGRTLRSLGLDQLERDALKELLYEGL
jgi:opine dehydrogenase